jgi:hypothetical protein
LPHDPQDKLDSELLPSLASSNSICWKNIQVYIRILEQKKEKEKEL